MPEADLARTVPVDSGCAAAAPTAARMLALDPVCRRSVRAVRTDAQHRRQVGSGNGAAAEQIPITASQHSTAHGSPLN